MRCCAHSFALRVVCAVSVCGLLAIGPIGCDGSSAPPTGTSSQLPPEAKKANENMENFMKKDAEKK